MSQDVNYQVFDALDKHGHEQVIVCRDEVSGLKAIIAIHNTTLGPALGGCRMYPYASEQEALIDVLRLSRGMTYKAAISGLNLGGGKSVIIGDPKKHKSEILFRALGRFIEGLNGRYITAEDSGTSIQDMEHIRMETNWVVGISRSLGGSGDPSPVTALGVFSGMRAAMERKYNSPSFKGLKVAVQGCGQVGRHLIGHLLNDGAEVIATDIFQESMDRVKKMYPDAPLSFVGVDDIYDVDCDIFAPCALGGAINPTTIPRLKCSIVAGAANNQLANEKEDGPALRERNILYAPDYLINAGGLINVAHELEDYNMERALDQAKSIYNIMHRVFDLADKDGLPTWKAANKLAIERVKNLSKVRSTYTGTKFPLRGIS